MASAYFYELLTKRTYAACDQEHIDAVVCSHASTPDRTAFLTGKSTDSPLPVLCEDAKKLEKFGADVIVITCNTSHCFINEIRNSVGVPVPSMIEETVRFIIRLRLCLYRTSPLGDYRGYIIIYIILVAIFGYLG